MGLFSNRTGRFWGALVLIILFASGVYEFQIYRIFRIYLTAIDPLKAPAKRSSLFKS